MGYIGRTWDIREFGGRGELPRGADGTDLVYGQVIWSSGVLDL